MPITEDKVREIHQSKVLSGYTHEELHEADAWLKAYALDQLQGKLSNTGICIGDYVMLMARCHFGSVETDKLLTELDCYPSWMREG